MVIQRTETCGHDLRAVELETRWFAAFDAVLDGLLRDLQTLDRADADRPDQHVCPAVLSRRHPSFGIGPFDQQVRGRFPRRTDFGYASMKTESVSLLRFVCRARRPAGCPVRHPRKGLMPGA
jgi:hypothetical protein